MNRQEILNEINELKERINSLEKQYEALTPSSNRWRAERNDKYYYIGATGMSYHDSEKGTRTDKSRYKLGNYFKTDEEAEFEIERLKVVAELREYATPNDDFDWDDIEQKKCMLSLDDYGVEIDTYYNRQSSDLVFGSEEIASRAIEAVGEDRIIKYYFRRRENE